MEKTTRLRALLIFLIFSTFLSQIHAGNKQSQALNNLYKAKWSRSSTIDTTHFKPPPQVNTASLLSQEGLKKSDKIDRLPGQPYVRFDQYGGYVTVNESAGRAFYYYFVEADQIQTSNKSLPLLLWLNGGPGCSSLAYGAMQELGPFRVNSDGKTLYRNEFAWNHGTRMYIGGIEAVFTSIDVDIFMVSAANVLFVESPAGVGFSFSNTSSDYENSGDESTALDNYAFLLNWLERFPEYKEREFYISGESYAGHYVPQLAHLILYYNHLANKTLINLKGILIGNAVINDETDSLGMYDYFGSHAIVSDETLDEIRKYCDFSPKSTKLSDKCLKANDLVTNDLDQIDIYNIYAPLCSKRYLTSKPKKMSQVIDPCSELYTYAYMNRQDVQEALHANVTKLDHDWEACSDIIEWNDSPTTIIPLLREFMDNNLRVWIFSGDTDGRIPVTSTKYSINSMKLRIKTPWHTWFHGEEVGGFAQVYEEGLTFSTVLGAGHQVPSYKPKSALALVTHFLTGNPLDHGSR